MSLEGQLLDRKSLRSATGKTTDWPELAKDCVAFANALGTLAGIVDDARQASGRFWTSQQRIQRFRP